MSVSDDLQAIEYRRMMTQRAANKAAREAALKGDPEAVRRVTNAWAPLKRWEGWDGPIVEDNEK